MFYDIKYIKPNSNLFTRKQSFGTVLFNEETKHWRNCFPYLLSANYLSSKQITHFERSYVLGNLPGLLVTGTLTLWTRSFLISAAFLNVFQVYSKEFDKSSAWSVLWQRHFFQFICFSLLFWFCLKCKFTVAHFEQGIAL
jgi:hypothetical protein